MQYTQHKHISALTKVIYMGFKLYDHVIIKKNRLLGQIIDIHCTNGITIYTVESDHKGDRIDADYHSEWPLFVCRVDDIEHCHSTVLGLKSQESEKFLRFFSLIQSAAAQQGAVFFAQAGDGHDYQTPDMECEDMMGWLIPNSAVSVFESIWNAGDPDDSWTQYFCWAVWHEDNGSLRIRFEHMTGAVP